MKKKLRKSVCLSAGAILCFLCAVSCKHKEENSVIEQGANVITNNPASNAKLKELSIGYIKGGSSVAMTPVKGFTADGKSIINLTADESVNIKFKMIPEAKEVSSVTLQNKTVSTNVMRASKTGTGGYTSPAAVSLTNGINDIEIKVTSKDKSTTKIYELKIKYNEPKNSIPTNAIFDGFKCPDAALDECVWIIFGNGG